MQGRDGEKEILVDRMGRTISEVSVADAVPGKDVYLSIDMELQDAVYEALEQVVSCALEQLKGKSGLERLVYKYMLLDDVMSPDELLMLLYELILQKIQKLEITPSDLALDPCSGSAVVADTKTGKVLACVSYPSYDNNRFANDIDVEYYSKICQNGSLPLYNRATQQLSAPGSTLKPVTIIAGIQEGVIDFQTSVFCDGVFDKVFPPIKCWNHAGHGEVMTTAGAVFSVAAAEIWREKAGRESFDTSR